MEDNKTIIDPNTTEPKLTTNNSNEQDIPISEVKDGKDTVKVKFMDKDFISDYVKKTTVKSNIDDIRDDKKEISVEDLRKKITVEEKQYENQFTKADFDEISIFIIDLIDSGISTSLRIYSKDKSDKDYQIDTVKKGKLAKQLSLLLVKYKLKWSIEFVFLLSLCIFYAGPVQRARKRKKTLGNINEETKPYVRNENPIKEEEIKETKLDESSTNTSPKITRKGRPFSKIK